ncbi:MAG: GNAT family N-acetyltransferase [Blastocatellales bacterium]
MEAVTMIEIEPLHTGFRVAPMTSEVLSSVVALENECGLNSRGVDGYQKMLLISGAVLLTAIEGDESHRIVGVFSGNVVVDELQIDNLAVIERCRCKGIGHMLLKSALSFAGRLGAHTAILEVRSANLRARSFYEKEGFVIIGVRKCYYTAPPDDALLLSRKIQSES